MGSMYFYKPNRVIFYPKAIINFLILITFSLLTKHALAAAPIIDTMPDYELAINNESQPSMYGFYYTVTDSDTPLSGLSISVTSSDNSILQISGGPPPHIMKLVLVNRMPGASGLVTITVTISDGSSTDTESFQVQVGPTPSEAPIISPIEDQLLEAHSGPTQRMVAFNYQVSDVDTDFSELTTSVSSSNPALISIASSPPPHIATVGLFNLQANVGGTVQLSISISDGVNTTTESFNVRVSAPPVLNQIDDRNIEKNSGPGNKTVSFSYSLSDIDTQLQDIQLSISSSNESLLQAAGSPPPHIAKVALFNLLPGVIGSSVVTINASDGERSDNVSFTVNVSENNPPSILSLIHI